MALKYLSHWRVFDAPGAQARERAVLLGYVARLRGAGRASSGLTLAHARNVVLPAIQQRRIKFYFNEDGDVVAYLIWARLVPDVEARVASTAEFALHESEWNEGTSLWLVEVVAPLGNFAHVVREIGSRLFAPGERLSYVRRRRPDGDIRRLSLHLPTHCGIRRPGMPQQRLTRAAIVTPDRLAVPLADASFDDPEDAGIASLAARLAGARVVVLGQQAHGDSNAMAFKARLVRRLQQRHGFGLLAMEAGSFDTARCAEIVADGGRHAEAARGALFHMVAEAPALQPFFGWLDAQAGLATGLRLAGFHSKHTGRHALDGLCNRLRTWLAEANADPLAQDDWRHFTLLAGEAMRMSTTAPQQIELARWQRCLRALRQATATRHESPRLLASPAYWQRALGELESQANRYWGLGGDWVSRERVMADYLLWLLERHPERRMIVWTHNLHAQRHREGHKMASFMSNALGPQLVTVGFTASRGTFTDWKSGQLFDVPPASSGSVEDSLSRVNAGGCYVDLRDPQAASATGGRPWRYCNYQEDDFALAEAFDVLVHLARTTPVLKAPA